MSAECSQTFDEVRDLARSAPKRCAGERRAAERRAVERHAAGRRAGERHSEWRSAEPHAAVQTSVAQSAADAQPVEKNRPGRRLVTIGVLLVALAAVVTFLGWRAQGEARDASSRECAAILAELGQTTSLASGGSQAGGAAATGEQTIANAQAASSAPDPNDLPVLQVNGVDVVGRLHVDGIGLDLPVAAKGGDTSAVPGVVDARDGELAIEGERYMSAGAMGAITSLAGGTKVTFAQVNGQTTTYSVVGSGVTGEQFNDNFDLLVYYQDAFGQKGWVGCSMNS